MEALITEHVNFLIFELFWQGVFALGYLLINVCDFCWLHFVPSHPTGRAVEIM
jgi:hypothetical protein